MSVQSEIDRINNEVETQEGLIAHLKTVASNLPNAEGDEDDDGGVSLEMPIIRFIGLRGNKVLNDIPASYELYEEQNLTFTIGIMGGSLKVGDTLQMCGMRTFKKSPKNPATKRKLRRFAEYLITEDDLDRSALELTVTPTKNAFAHLGHNNRQSGGPSIYYFRIRRPVGSLQNNASGMTVNAKFSNVVPVSMLNIKGQVDDTEYQYVNVNVI